MTRSAATHRVTAATRRAVAGYRGGRAPGVGSPSFALSIGVGGNTVSAFWNGKARASDIAWQSGSVSNLLAFPGKKVAYIPTPTNTQADITPNTNATIAAVVAANAGVITAPAIATILLDFEPGPPNQNDGYVLTGLETASALVKAAGFTFSASIVSNRLFHILDTGGTNAARLAAACDGIHLQTQGEYQEAPGWVGVVAGYLAALRTLKATWTGGITGQVAVFPATVQVEPLTSQIIADIDALTNGCAFDTIQIFYQNSDPTQQAAVQTVAAHYRP